jgi:hypothetical protein
MKYLVFYNSQNTNSISIGDVIRFLELIKLKNFSVVSNKSNQNFFRNFNNKNIINIKDVKKIDKQSNIINLTIGLKLKKTFFDINDFLTKDKINKVSTFKIIQKFKKKINYKEPPYKKNYINRKSIIGINWIVPLKWKIKSYPMDNWKVIEKDIRTNYSLKVSWQKKCNLETYVRWIKSCDILISVVGLGVHIGSYFNKEIIMLSGPTDFYESNKNPKIVKIKPDKKCKIHEKKLNVFYKNCNCMKKIKVRKILNNIESRILN